MTKLKSSVVVNGTLYEAGSEPPKDVAGQITNPDAWDGDPPRSRSRRSRRDAGDSGEDGADGSENDEA